MISRTLLEEEQAIARCASEPAEVKPRFEWNAGLSNGNGSASPAVSVMDGDELREVEPSDIAFTIGSALTNLMRARNETDIFTAQNRDLVTKVCSSVISDFQARQPLNDDGKIVLTELELTQVIEHALEKNHAYDVARSFLVEQSLRLNGNSPAASGHPPLGRQDIPVKVIRRNGDIVEWNRHKIESAVRKAFLSLHMDSSPAVEIADEVSRRILETGKEFIDIEDLQDLVQESLMRRGHFKVAESYILYRAHRAIQRAEEQKEASADETDSRQESMILVKQPDGTNTFWDGADLLSRIEFARQGLDLAWSKREMEQELRRSIFPEMTMESLKTTIILNAKALIEKDAEFAKFAGRILLTYIYEEVLGWNILEHGVDRLDEFHQKAFAENLKRAVEIERVDPALLKLDLEALAKELDTSADLGFDYLGIQTLYDRYLIVDKTAENHRRLETPQLFWMRVAMGIFHREEDCTDRVLELYRLYKARRFCSSTPTLFNSGTLHSQLSSCYLYKVDDSLESIMVRGIAENASLSKWAGGLGGSWTAVRGTGGYIKGTNGESQGVIPFLKLHNDQLVAVNQGGKRKGSGCAYLETWHNDIDDFLELRKNTGDERRRTHDMNTANWVPDLFMKRMEARAHWTLFRSSEAPDLHELYGQEFEKRYEEYEAMAQRGEIFGKQVPAIELWKSMLKMLFETGHPWITFKDPCNVRSPQDHTGVIHSSNLCTEITLNTSDEETAVCNLGSVVLDQHVDESGALDHDKLRDTIHTAVRALDNVIDINFYPTKAAERANLRHRPIGLGIMGLQNALYKRGVAFASPEAVEFNDEFMEAIAFYAYEASSDLAAEKGTYSSYKGSKWDRGLLPQDTLDLLEDERGVPIEVPREGKMDWKPLRKKIARQGMRNSNVIAIAPTATISNIMGSSPCIEPLFKNLFVKSNLGGDFIMLNPYLVKDLKELNLWNQEMVDRLKYHEGELAQIPGIPDEVKDRYQTAFGIPYEFLIEAAARRQKWIDQSQSLNLFLAEPDMKTLSHMYRAAWHKGLKTTYYLRTTAASRIEQSTTNTNKELRGLVARDMGHSEMRETEPTAAAAPETEAVGPACSLDPDSCESCQ